MTKERLARGFTYEELPLSHPIRSAVEHRDWSLLDSLIAIETQPEGIIFERLRGFAHFSSIEFIISIRSSNEFPDDDGIWHDDGSRVLAFSLSLTLEPSKIEGGILEIRKRFEQNAPSQLIPTPAFGTMIVFATGHDGFEHKINRVSAGERVIIAGWCT